ncbi:MAG: RlmE family RNA methyltransferase [Alphaproteobacteria bacterium]|nr:RlmE family RNA methyltransferase [Alphaproteobacteria bacterium]
MARDNDRSAGAGRGGTTRRAAVRVRTARQRSASSTQWLERQLNDPYVGEARQRGYRSRAAFKLAQLDDRFHLLRRGMRIVDLGCAPGGWLQVAVERTKPGEGRGVVLGIDILETDPIPGAAIIALDFLDPAAPERLSAALGGAADLVLSDMAAPTTGHAATDHLRIVALAEAAFAFARDILAPGGAFVAKVFQGGAEGALLAALKRDFKTVRHAKPPASRAQSSEMYVVATGFRGKRP